jgi:hypothetical protein
MLCSGRDGGALALCPGAEHDGGFSDVAKLLHPVSLMAKSSHSPRYPESAKGEKCVFSPPEEQLNSPRV